MTSAGSSKASSPTRSAPPRSAKRSIIVVAIWRICGSSSAIRRGVNAFLMKPRSRVWSGGCLADRPLTTEKPPSSSTRCTSGGRGWNGVWVFSEENVAGSRKISRMSS